MKNINLNEGKKYTNLLLENKVCVIVGAASLRSIGYATAELFAAHGAKLVLLDLVMNEEIANEVGTAIASHIGHKPDIIYL